MEELPYCFKKSLKVLVLGFLYFAHIHNISDQVAEYRIIGSYLQILHKEFKEIVIAHRLLIVWVNI
jgi:hypothetical protein